MAELFGNSRSQQLAGGKPSDVLALCWILELAERDRSLNLLGKGAAFHLGAPFPRAREGGASASGVSIRRRRRAAMGTVRREPIETPLAEGSVAGVRSGISGDRALDPWACGRRTARGQSWSPGAGRCRGPPPFSVWDLEIAVAELFGNSRSQQLAGGKPSDVLARCWILELAERDRSLNLLGKGAAFHLGAPFPRAREGGASASGVSIRRRRRAAMGTVRREPIETPLAEGRVNFVMVVSSRARGRRVGRRFRSAAPARSYGVCSARADRNRWLRMAVACVRSGISGWVIGS